MAHGQHVVGEYIESNAPIEACVFITHLHLDHLIGLPFFTPMYMKDATIDLFGPRMGHFDSFEEAVASLIHPPFFPVPLHEMSAVKRFHDMTEAHTVYFLEDGDGPIQRLDAHPSQPPPPAEKVAVRVECMRGYNHPKSGVLLYKVVAGDKSVVYATDTEGYVHGDQRLTEFAHGADVLIHDAMYTSDRYISMPSPTQGYGHSTVEIATEVARRADVGRLFLFHHDPTSTDDDLDAVAELGAASFEATEVARDGLTVEV